MEKPSHKSTTVPNTGEKARRKKWSVVVGLIFAAALAVFMSACGVRDYPHNVPATLSGPEAAAHETRCNGLNVVVRSPNSQDALIACEGARDALGFLESSGLNVTGQIAVELSIRLPSRVSGSAAGCYLELERIVRALTYAEFKTRGTWFGVPIDRSLYQSVVSHEVAHWVADVNFTISAPSIQAKEYIAYVTQFSAMAPVLREQILSQFEAEAFKGDWQITTTIYMLDCMSFGVRAYLHFRELPAGKEYLRAILTGRALTE